MPAGLNVQSVISNRRLVVRLLDKRLDEQQLLRKSRFCSVRVHQTARHQLLACTPPRKTRLMRNPAVDDFCLLRQKLLQDSNQALLGRRGVIRDIWNERGSIKTDFPSCQLLPGPALNPEKLVWNQDQKLAGFQMNTCAQSQNILTTLVSPSQDFRL